MSQIRPMTFDEVAQLVTWAADEGWNPGLHDAQLFWDLDPEGFLALEENGRMIGGGAIIRHGATFGFMGLFIVNKAFRGSGLGTKLWYARRDCLLSRLPQAVPLASMPSMRWSRSTPRGDLSRSPGIAAFN